MKLKTLFVIFNVLIGISFLFVFLMPAMFLGWDYAGVFWGENWYLALLFVAVFAVLNLFFGLNYRLFTALEREDWDAVISVLEKRVLEKHRFTAGNIRILVNAYIIRSLSERIGLLEQEIRDHKPQLLPRYALVLGIPHFLSNDGTKIVEYYGPFVHSVKGTAGDWVRWSYAFGLMLQQRSEEAQETLESLCENGKDVVVQALSGYLLEAYADQDDKLSTRIHQYRSSITGRISRKEWEKTVEKQRSELYVLILSKLLLDVTEWLYKENDR